MSIQRLSSANPYNQTVEDIDNNEFELQGILNQANFEKHEIDALYADLGVSRKFIVLSGAGSSLATVGNWSHVKAEDGYSIWKIPFTNFTYNADNEMYFDDKIITFKGQANQESYSAFTKVFTYDGATYTDRTTEAGTETGTAFTLMEDTSDYLYIGLSSTFSGIDFNFNVKGANYTLKIEYYSTTWTTMTANANDLDDNTSNFRRNGRIEFTIPSDWAQTAVNSSTQYWVRISTTTAPVTDATAYSIFPGSSVYSLLQLSSANILDEEWSWCYFNSYVYVTVRNSGATAYEGNKFITSSSSTTNKQNYFIYNHAYKLSYEQSSYTTGASYTAVYGYRWYNTGATINIINWSTTTPFRITNTRSTALAFRLDAGTNDITTGASTGGAGTPPAQISKYLAISVDGTTYKIPLYAS